jgi:hypothetical protein
MKRLIEILACGVTDNAGNVLENGQVTSYLAGTTTLHTLYSDWDLSLPYENPLTLDAAGRAIAYSDRRLKFVIADEEGLVVRTIDYIGTEDQDINDALTSLVAGDGLLESADGVWSINDDDSTLTIDGDILKVKDAGIIVTQLGDASVETAKIKDANVTQAKRVALGQQVSSSSGSFNTTSSSFVDVTNLSVSITTTGRPVFIMLISDGSTTASNLGFLDTDNTGQVSYRLLRNSTEIARWTHYGTSSSNYQYIPATLPFIDVVAVGTYTYKLQATTSQSSSVFVYNFKLIAFEL